MNGKYEWVNGEAYGGDALGITYVRDKKTDTVVRFEDFIQNPSDCMRFHPASFIYNDYDFWNFVCATSPSAYRYVPNKFQTPDLIRTVANSITSYDHDLHYMNMAIVEKMEGREAALDIYKSIVRRFCFALREVPKNYWTDELVDIAITEHLAAFSILSDEEKTDKRCITSVSKWGRSLRFVPKDKKKLLVNTPDGEKRLFEIAVLVDGLSLKVVPEEERCHDVCLKACTNNIDAITAVPAAVVTPKFIEELKEKGIDIPAKHMTYVRECLKSYGKMNGLIDLNKEACTLENAADSSSFNGIALEEIPYMISKPILEKLSENGITSLGELFRAYENANFVVMFTPKVYAEISGVVNALSCKFKGQDPELDFSEISSEYMVSKLGFSRRVANQVEHLGLSVGKLIEQTHLPVEKQVWGSYIRGVGEVSINESITKLSVFADYYDQRGKSEELKQFSFEAEASNLSQELQELRHQRRVLDNKIDATIAKIIELTKKNNMSGGIAYVRK